MMHVAEGSKKLFLPQCLKDGNLTYKVFKLKFESMVQGLWLSCSQTFAPEPVFIKLNYEEHMGSHVASSYQK